MSVELGTLKDTIKHSWTPETLKGRTRLVEKGSEVVECLHDKLRVKKQALTVNSSIKTPLRLLSRSISDASNHLLLQHTKAAYAAATLPKQHWVDDTNEPNKEFIELLDSVGLRVENWEETTWHREQTAVLLMTCKFAQEEKPGYHVVRAMIVLDELGVNTTRLHQELSNLATDREFCPWEQLLFMRYVWQGVLETWLGEDNAKHVLDLKPAFWALHDEECNREIWKVCRSGAPEQKCECLRGHPAAFARRVYAWLNIDLRPLETSMYDTMRVVHGTDIAVYFVFESAVSRSLGFLTMLVPIFILWNGMADQSFNTVGRPLLALVLCLWSSHILRRWRLVYSALGHRWYIEENSEYHKLLPHTQEVMRKKFKAYPFDSGNYPACFRAMRTLMLLPAVCLCWVLICFMLGFTFYLEMWIVYEWADCRRMNRIAGEAGREPDCDGADRKYGFPGTLVEMMPGLLEGILFEIAKVFARKCSAVVTAFQNWRTITEHKTAYELQVYMLEFLSKFCVFVVLAFAFVPQWDYYDIHKPFWAVTDEDCAEFFLGTFGPTCIRVKIPHQLRLKLLKGSMIGCFIVAPIVSMLLTCAVPYIFKKCMYPSKGPFQHCWLCRLLALAFFLEEDALGGFCSYVLFGREKPVTHLKTKCPNLMACTERNLRWGSIVKQGCQKEFKPIDCYIDLVVHINFIATFGVVFPTGVILNFVIIMLRLRGEVFMVMFEKQRRLSLSCQATETQQKCLHVILGWQLAVAVIFNGLFLMLPFRTLEHWDSQYEDLSLDAYKDQVSFWTCFIIIFFGFILIVLRDHVHWLPMPSLHFVRDWREHERAQRIDLNYFLRRDCNQALAKCEELREDMNDECGALRDELQQVRQELAELRQWKNSVCGDRKGLDVEMVAVEQVKGSIKL